ncbi:polysaccharide deacetylase family protein [Streptomyces brasiliensis]|uniref:polysaccharide deacetylase family protein n=1 Tax=Streptomyces brasiliensis TaxID=1954 RepID=UPI00167186E3|nr:polysaccharide deacetylase family protein [Streptomyces brasiliensis]
MTARPSRHRTAAALCATVLSVAVSALGTTTAAAAAQHPPFTRPVHPHTVDCRAVKCVALTFDDGPTRYTAALLTTLEHSHALATFFLIGPHALQHRADVLREYRDGDAIGDHTVTHPHLTLLTLPRVHHQIEAAAQQIASVTGHRPVLFRPPFGAWNARVRKAAGTAGMAVVMWNVNPRDWKHHDPAFIDRAVLARVRPGAIVDLHDRYATTPPAVPRLIDVLRARGYKLVTVPQLFATSGGLRSGVVYHHGPGP